MSEIREDLERALKREFGASEGRNKQQNEGAAIYTKGYLAGIEFMMKTVRKELHGEKLRVN